ncbi:hypothetical protein ACPCAJ_02125 [Streptomyces griseoincarnatus]
MTSEATYGSTLRKPEGAHDHGPWPARGAVIEIIETGRTTDETPGGSVITPNDIRINGQSLLSPRECPVTIHEMQIDSTSLVAVTLTLLARRVSIHAEGDVEAPR